MFRKSRGGGERQAHLLKFCILMFLWTWCLISAMYWQRRESNVEMLRFWSFANRVWDLDGNESVTLRLRSPGISVCWHPEEALKVTVVFSKSSTPALLVWNHRKHQITHGHWLFYLAEAKLPVANKWQTENDHFLFLNYPMPPPSWWWQRRRGPSASTICWRSRQSCRWTAASRRSCRPTGASPTPLKWALWLATTGSSGTSPGPGEQRGLWVSSKLLMLQQLLDDTCVFLCSRQLPSGKKTSAHRQSPVL